MLKLIAAVSVLFTIFLGFEYFVIRQTLFLDKPTNKNLLGMNMNELIISDFIIHKYYNWT